MSGVLPSPINKLSLFGRVLKPISYRGVPIPSENPRCYEPLFVAPRIHQPSCGGRNAQTRTGQAYSNAMASTSRVVLSSVSINGFAECSEVRDGRIPEANA